MDRKGCEIGDEIGWMGESRSMRVKEGTEWVVRLGEGRKGWEGEVKGEWEGEVRGGWKGEVRGGWEGEVLHSYIINTISKALLPS